jgi:antitoxin component YwqK of YwqJK toxin-antitoxin module
MNKKYYIGYTIGNIYFYDNASKTVIIKLLIPKKAKNNINRKDIQNKKYARHICNLAYVHSIYDIKSSNFYEIAYDANLVYQIKKWISYKDYNDNNNINNRGIAFYLDSDVVVNNNLKNIKNGEFKKYYDNGQIRVICYYKNNILNGIYKEYDSDGFFKIKNFYKNGLLHGQSINFYMDRIVTSFYDYGNLMSVEINYR